MTFAHWPFILLSLNTVYFSTEGKSEGCLNFDPGPVLKLALSTLMTAHLNLEVTIDLKTQWVSPSKSLT